MSQTELIWKMICIHMGRDIITSIQMHNSGNLLWKSCQEVIMWTAPPPRDCLFTLLLVSRNLQGARQNQYVKWSVNMWDVISYTEKKWIQRKTAPSLCKVVLKWYLNGGHHVDMKTAPPWSRFGSTFFFQCNLDSNAQLWKSLEILAGGLHYKGLRINMGNDMKINSFHKKPKQYSTKNKVWAWVMEVTLPFVWK